MSGRSKGASSRPPNGQSCPWLMFSHGRSNLIQTFYCIADNRLLKRMLPHLSGSTIHANYDGWAVTTVEENSEDGDSFSCFLLHLTSMEKILLPNLEDIEFNECFISSSPLKPNCIVAFISRIDDDDGQNSRSRIKFWRPNQENWVELVTKECLNDLITCDGKIYGIHARNLCFGMVDIHDNDVRLINPIMIPDSKGSIRNPNFLIESCGDVFLVMKFMLGVEGKRVRTLQVYKLMQDKKTTKMYWIRLTDIGDRAFFIHDRNGFSCSAIQAGLKGNSIYFTGSGQDTHIYRYSLLENRFYRTLPCPDVVNDIRQICWLMIN